jgi:hypothetical protein
VLLCRHRQARIVHIDQQGGVEEHERDVSPRQKLIIEEKISLNVSRLVVNPACIAGVRTLRPNFSAM